MASEEQHCKDCIQELGAPYREVHQWLDAFYKTLGYKHRVRRHHVDGIEEVRRMWGDEAAQAAEVHIRRDCYGKIPTKEEAELWDLF